MSPPSKNEHNSKLRKQIQTRHLEVIGTDIDNKVCTYWFNAITEGLKNFDDFERSMIQSSQYEKRVLSLFKSSCLELLGTHGFDSKLFDDFNRSIKTRKPWQPVTSDIMDDYIRNTNAFRVKHMTLIQSISMLVLDREISTDHAETFFQKFRRDRTYDVQALKNDLTWAAEGNIDAAGQASSASASSSSAVSPKSVTETSIIRKSKKSNDSTSTERGEEKEGDSSPKKHTVVQSFVAPVSSDDITYDVNADLSYDEVIRSIVSVDETECVNARDGNHDMSHPSTSTRTTNKSDGNEEQTGRVDREGPIVYPPSSSCVGGCGGTNKARRIPSNAATAAAEADKSSKLQSRTIVNKYKEVLREFFEIYDRPMYVQEYMRFSNDHVMAHASTGQDTSLQQWKAVFEEEKPSLVCLINVSKTTYVNYVDRRLSDYEVVDRYLHLLGDATQDPEKVFVKIREEMVQTREYRDAMCDRISNIFAELFAAELSQEDVSYVFEKVKDRAISLTDDETHACVKKFKEEMDIITNNICDTYMAVYDRIPDQGELSKHVLEYRSKMAESELDQPSKLNRGIECALVSSLEFHDVLKSKLKQKHIDMKQDAMSAAVLYGSLEQALHKLQALPVSDRTMCQVDVIVSECIQGMVPM